MGLITPENTILSTQYPAIYNLSIVRATTTNAGDSIKITSASGTALSSANVGKVRLGATTAGQQTTFDVTADVTILLTGATWGIGGSGDITGAILRVLACNDNGTLRWGVAYLGGRHTLLTTDTNATQANVNLPEEVLCNTAVGSATNTCMEIGYFRANFDDTGGAAEDLWAIQTGIGDVVTGQSADGMWQPWNPVFTGFTAAGQTSVNRWCQVGRNIRMQVQSITPATSNATTFTMTAPAKTLRQYSQGLLTHYADNAVFVGGWGLWSFQSADTNVMTLQIAIGGGGWTAANTKGAAFNGQFEVGPAASFIE